MRMKTDKLNSRKTTWLLVGAGAAMVAGRVVERGLEGGWRAAKNEEPPSEGNHSWPAALAWAAMSAATVAAVELVARRGAYVGLKRLTGKRAPANL